MPTIDEIREQQRKNASEAEKQRKALLKQCDDLFKEVVEAVNTAVEKGQVLRELGLLDRVTETYKARDGKGREVDRERKVLPEYLKGLDEPLFQFKQLFTFKTTKEMQSMKEGQDAHKADKADAKSSRRSLN